MSEITLENGWLIDANGNKNSMAYWGTEERAREALASLVDCINCINCSDCSRCSNVAFLYSKKDLRGDLAALGQPAIPRIENIHARVLEAVSKPDALDMGSWHTCDTTHCRAGWVVHLAGEAGYALERFHNTALAAQLIYRESGYQINPGRFYDNGADAMADMKRLAETAVGQ